MLLVAWLLIVQVYGVIADNVDLTEDKTYWFIIPEQGFSIKICGEGSGEPQLCYDSVKGDRIHGECSDSTSCVIGVGYFEMQNKKQLIIGYGGGRGFFKPECTVVKVEEKIQYGVNITQDGNGTCQWKTDAKRMLAVGVTTAVGYTMTILDVRQVPDANESAVPFWVYIVSGVGGLAVIAGVGVGGYFLYRFIKKRKNDGQAVKEGEKNDPKAIATEKNPRLEEEAANFVGQSRERGTKEKVETKKDELSDGKETIKKTSDEPMKDKPAEKDEKKKE
uniref:Uncharacterized protein n=1 Tax=Panagrolaimus sp. JU765 TaxID=591449 RepID=A0AC34Q3N1_9BILA